MVAALVRPWKRKPCASARRASEPTAEQGDRPCMARLWRAELRRRRVTCVVDFARSTRSGTSWGNQNGPGSPPDSRGLPQCGCCEELRAPVSEGNDLDIPQCWPVPFRTCARLVKPRGPSRWPPRVARSWTGLCEWPPRPPRGSNRSTVRCLPPASLTQTPGLSGAWGVPTSSSTGACSLETAPANPRQAQTTKVCAYVARVLRLPSGRLACGLMGHLREPFLAQRCAGLAVSCEVRLLGDLCCSACFLEVPPSGARRLHPACHTSATFRFRSSAVALSAIIPTI